MTKNQQTMVECPRCGGEGEEPGAPVSLSDGLALCLCCRGRGVVTPERARREQEEETCQ